MNTPQQEKQETSAQEKAKTIQFRQRSETMNAAPDKTALGAGQAETNSQPSSAAQTMDVTSGNIDKIRNIIFGDQMRNYEKKFKRMEDRLNQELTDIREETRRQFASLETHISKEIDSLVNRLKTEQDERTQSVREVVQELEELARDLDQKLTRMDHHANETQRELRQQLLDQSKALRDELRQKSHELTVALENETQELADDKVSRSALASLLTEVAMQLNSEMNNEEA